MRILLLAVALAVMVLAATSCQTEASKNEAAKAEVFPLIQNSETFKLPVEFVHLALGTFYELGNGYGSAGNEKEMEALLRAGLINVLKPSLQDERNPVTISLTRKGEAESRLWEKGAGYSNAFGHVEDWKIPTGQLKLTEINHFIQEDDQTADVKFTFVVVPNKLGEIINDLNHQLENKKHVARLTLKKRVGKWYLSEKELQESMRLAFASNGQN